MNSRALLHHVAISTLIAVLLALTANLFASGDLPEETIGYQDASYGLSQYETVNLSNGNLTFRLPLYSLRTDGGLSYDLALVHNSKMWETRKRCIDLPPYEPTGCTPGSYDDKVITQEIASGIDSFGYGWELRPPRIVASPSARDFAHPTAWIDTSGAKHYLSGKPAWWSTGVNSGVHSPCVLNSTDINDDGNHCYTVDGSNIRLTVVDVEDVNQEGELEPVTVPVSVLAETPDGTRFIHDHPVAQNSYYGPVIADAEDIRSVNFRTEVGGLYVSAIERGPVVGTTYTNRIEFDYYESSTDSGAGCPDASWDWLPTNVRVAAGQAGGYVRELSLSYEEEAHLVKPELGNVSTNICNVPMLRSIDAPSFNDGSDGDPTATIFLNYEDYASVPDYSQAKGLGTPPLNGSYYAPFKPPLLTSVTLPGGAGTFAFENTNDWGILSKVTLPVGAEVEYGYGNWPSSGSRCLGGDGCTSQPYCGTGTRAADTRPDPNDLQTGRWNYTDGVWRRTIRYSDLGGSRVDETVFAPFLACKPTVWPYDFSYALTGLTSPEDEQSYFWIYVGTNGTGIGDDDGGEMRSPSWPWQAEIHRFHPQTKEEFSADYLDTTTYWTVSSEDGAEPLRSSTNETIRVLRHERVTHEEKYDVGKWWIPTFPGDQGPWQEHARYSTVTRRDTLTNTSSTSDTGDVLDCTSAYTVASGPNGDDTCTTVSEITDLVDVDKYLNPQSTVVTSSGWPGGDVSRTTTRDFLSDEDKWYLSLPVKQTTCIGASCETSGSTWEWDSAASWYRQTKSFTNPSGGAPDFNFSCTTDNGDCVQHDYTYDNAGNLKSDEVSGGYGAAGFDKAAVTTRTTWAHGRPVKKELEGGGQSLLLWQREVDPWSTLTRWHVGGNGAGFAYDFDQRGRVTDIAPVEWAFDSEHNEWTLAIQSTPTLDGSDTLSLYGTHIDYVLPDAQLDFIHHDVYDASCSLVGTAPSCSTDGGYRNRYVFDGMGRKAQTVERMPGTSTYRTRFDLQLFQDPEATGDTCQDLLVDGDPPTISRFALESAWISGSAWPTEGCAASELHWTLTQLDGIGRPRQLLQPDGSTVDMDYVGDAQTITTSSVTTALDGTSSLIKRRETTDALGRLVALDEQLAASPTDYNFHATYGYDQGDRLTDVDLLDGEVSQTREYKYSGAGFLKESIEPERHVTSLTYDALGNVRTEKVGQSPLQTHTYDDPFARPTGTAVGDDQLTSIAYGDVSPMLGKSTTAGIFEPGYNQVVKTVYTNSYTEPPSGSVDVTHQWLYSGPGRRVSGRTTAINGVGGDDDSFGLAYDYDRWGNPRTLFYPEWEGCRGSSDWRGVFRTWDGPWLTRVSREDVGGTQWPVANLTYLTNGRLGTAIYPQGPDEWTETADSSGLARPGTITFTHHVSGTRTHGPFTYDGSGNITAIGAKRYAYDGVGRLTAYGLQGDTSLSTLETYQYDRWGNMESRSRVGQTDWVYDVLDSNRIDGITVGGASANLVWDIERGNLTEIPRIADQRHKIFRYSQDDRMLESVDIDDVNHETRWRYAYDASGERVARWTRDITGYLEADLYIRDEGGQVVSEWRYTDDGALFDVVREYVAGGGRTYAQIDYNSLGDELLQLAPDHLGSTRWTFNASGLVDEVDYYPFGDLTPGSTSVPSTTHLFTGHERDLGDLSSGLDYMHARYYSAGLSRFLSVDPVQGEVGLSQSWNRYSYVRNNPVLLTDPNGETVGFNTIGAKGGLPKLVVKIAQKLDERFDPPTVNNMGTVDQGLFDPTFLDYEFGIQLGVAVEIGGDWDLGLVAQGEIGNSVGIGLGPVELISGQLGLSLADDLEAFEGTTFGGELDVGPLGINVTPPQEGGDFAISFQPQLRPAAGVSVFQQKTEVLNVTGKIRQFINGLFSSDEED